MGAKSRATKPSEKKVVQLFHEPDSPIGKDMAIARANVIEFFEAWKRRDWAAMLERSTLTWKKTKPDHKEPWFDAMFGDYHIIAFEPIEGTEWVHGAIHDIQLGCFAEVPGQFGSRKLIHLVRSVKEAAPYDPVVAGIDYPGEWGVNPVSALRVGLSNGGKVLEKNAYN